MTTGPYSGRSAALATRHGKQAAVAPVFGELLGMEIAEVEVDTDAFGTFAGEVPRVGSPLDTAIAKARAGMEASGLPLGLASEGTIGPDPLVPFTTCDHEVIAFVDDERGIVIAEWFRGTDIMAFRASVRPTDDLTAVEKAADFPRHGLLVRPDGPLAGPIIKGITDSRTLVAAVRECSIPTGAALVESDFRAHLSPTRMANIARCAAALATRMGSPCPTCQGPGWGSVEPARGLPCSACGTLVATAVRAQRLGCPSCSARQELPSTRESVEPRWCPSCNP